MFIKFFTRCLFLIALTISPLWAGKIGTFTSDAAGFYTNSFYYDDGKEVTVIDTQVTPQLAEKLIAQIKAETKSPITRIIVTHPNPDKFNGLSAFHALDAESIASNATATAMPGVHEYKKYYWVQIAKVYTEATYPKLEKIKTTFSGEKKITLKSGETITLIELKNSGVSSTQTVVRIDQTGDLVVGDLLTNKVHAWLEGGIVNNLAKPDLKSWQAALQELETLSSNAKGKIYGGRGSPGPIRDLVKAEINYLSKVDQMVTKYVSKAPAAELKDFTKAASHYEIIENQIVKAFPDYQYPNLIRYGVYGLVNSKLKP